MRALVIDDSKTTRSIIRQYMRELDFDVIEAGDGGEALKCLQQDPNVDIALVDWHMPVMTGLEFVKQLRSRPEHNKIKLIMVTIENDATRIQEALAAGANEFVMKPFTFDVLEQKLALLLDGDVQ